MAGQLLASANGTPKPRKASQPHVGRLLERLGRIAKPKGKRPPSLDEFLARVRG